MEALQRHPKLTQMDVRKNGLSEQAEKDIQAVLTQRFTAVKQQQRKVFTGGGWDESL